MESDGARRWDAAIWKSGFNFQNTFICLPFSLGGLSFGSISFRSNIIFIGPAWTLGGGGSRTSGWCGGGRTLSSSLSSSWPSGGQLGAASESLVFLGGNRRNESKEDYKAEAVLFCRVCARCLVCLFFNCPCDYWGFFYSLQTDLHRCFS